MIKQVDGIVDGLLLMGALLLLTLVSMCSYHAMVHRYHGETHVSANCVWPTKCFISSSTMSPYELGLATSSSALVLLTMATTPSDRKSVV